MDILTITNTLEKLEKMHRSLYELAQSKTDIIKSNEIEKLDQMLKTEQAHVAAIETLEQQRQIQVKQFLTSMNYSYDGVPTVAHLIEAAHGQFDTKAIEDIRNNLTGLLNKLKEQNDLNQKLIFQSLQFVNFSLQMVRPQQQENINYSDQEVLGKNNAAKKSYFDSQA